MLRIGFYAPFKPLSHPRPSGDLTIGTGLYHYLQQCGHSLGVMSRFRARWVYWRPWLWPRAMLALQRSCQRAREMQVDLWFSYHTYYKAPDIIGPFCCRRLQIPYLIFQGIYSTKRKKDWRTWPGFMLNRYALLAAAHVFTNRKEDLLNLERLLPQEKLSYIVPGLEPDRFQFDPMAREQLRHEWGITDEVVVLSAAMFRPGVKSDGIGLVIRCCGKLRQKNNSIYLAIAGRGSEKRTLERLAKGWLQDRVRFVGQVPREEMYRFYSAGDLFLFPGIRESLGMVFLEAQSCGLPVVAFADGGVPEVVANGVSGLLVEPYSTEQLIAATEKLVLDRQQRYQMGQAAQQYVRQHHDLLRNYGRVNEIICETARTAERAAAKRSPGYCQ
ncbi:MAG: glycosyltransferase family 4 protein [Deltaproteobacteria bacterium]|nr:glycosyltransferase family 4 protein [Deltaproteobacteria bacterium]